MAEPTFQQLTRQVQLLTQRVAALEQELGISRDGADDSRVPVPEPEPPPMPKPSRDLESKLGLRLVNRVGAVTLILGVAFFFRYAVENNLIGETARVLFGAAAGLLLLAGGEAGWRRNQTIFAQGITGAGAAILYLSCYAAFSSYNLISLSVALVFLAGVTAISALLAVRYGSQAIALLALLGGLLVPLLPQRGQMGVWFVPIYLAVLDAGFLQLAEQKSWRRCEWLALTGTLAFTVDMAETPLRVLLPVYYLLFATRPNRWLFLFAHLGLLGRAAFLPERLAVYAPNLLGMSLAGLAIVRWRKWFSFTAALVGAAGVSWLIAGANLPLTGALAALTALFSLFLVNSAWRALTDSAAMTWQETAAMPLTALLYFAACYARLEGWANSRAALLSVALAGIYLALAARLRALPGLVSAGIAIALITAAIPIQFNAFRITVAWALEGTALVWIGERRKVQGARIFGLSILAGAVLHFAFAVLTPHSTGVIWNPRFLTALGVAAALFLAAKWSGGSVVAAGVPGITGHVVLLTAIAYEVVDRARTANAASATISILFAAYAVALVAIGTAGRLAANRYAGLGLIALVVAKLYLYDVWQLDTVYRFIAFAALGALLLATSFLYSRYRDRIALWLTLPGASEVHPPPPQE